LSDLSEADDDNSRRIGPVLDAIADALGFTADQASELDAEKVEEALSEAMSSAPELTQRFLDRLKKKGGLNLETLASDESDQEDGSGRVQIGEDGTITVHRETVGPTPKVKSFMEAVLALVEERGEDRDVAWANLFWSFGSDSPDPWATFNAYVAALTDSEFDVAVREKADFVIAARVSPIAPWTYRGFKVMPVKGGDGRGRWTVRISDGPIHMNFTADCEVNMRRTLDQEIGSDGSDEDGDVNEDEHDADGDDTPSRPLLPFDAKKNSFLQASMCIYQAAAGDGLFNDEEIDGFIEANEELSRVYDLSDDADLIKTGVKAQKTVDAVYAKYSTIPLDEIHRNARKLATKIDDPFLQKVIVLLSIKAADADDDLNDYEMQVINIYLEKWNLSLDEVEEIDGEF